jgi:uncharacterized membrane protein
MEFFGILFGLLGIGYLIFFLLLPFVTRNTWQRLAALERKLGDLEDVLQKQPGPKLRPEEPAEAPVEPEPVTAEESAAPVVEAAQPAITPAGAAEEPPLREAEAAGEPVAAAAGAPAPSAAAWTRETGEAGEGSGWQPLTGNALLERFQSWLLGGNTVARIGIVILLLGVAFFLKYAVDRGWLPIELRLAGAALGGLALIATGWRLRARRLNYALILQGGGMGIVYLTVFAAVSLYNLMATVPGLVLMVVLVVLSSALAALQNARSLALLAMIGGFLAPILISRDGSHVTLFSYYAVLNAGILGMAWFKSWRVLNLTGFVFTFVIGGAWGYQYYQPGYFGTTEPFLVLFFVFYVAVPVLFAQRQPPNLKGHVDGSLVFGVPLVAFGLQGALVRDFEYGLALSALGASLFYAFLASALWRGRHENMRMLTEAFLALAVAFGTLAIPLAVDGRWTGAAWALEGAALVWIGVRQQRLLARLFGLLVQAGAGVAFLSELGAATADIPVLNSFYLSALMVSFSGLFTAFYIDRHRQALRAEEIPASALALLWGLFWWFGAGINEILQHLDAPYHANAILGLVTASVAVITALRRRLDWQYLAFPPLVLLPAMALVAVVVFSDPGVAHPLTHRGWLAWPVALVVEYWLLRRLEPDWPEELAVIWHSATLWLAVFLVTWEAAWVVEQATTGPTWRYITWALVPAAVITAMPGLESRFAWPVRQFKTPYSGLGLLPLVLLLGLWVLHASMQVGDPRPLPYLPLLNPLELSQSLVLVTILWWTRRGWVKISRKSRWYTVSGLVFITLNGMIARATHHLGNVAFDAGALWSSPTYQSVVSITWTLAALGVMVSATRLKQRIAWVAGAALLGAVVVKLFLVDLADIGTIARIVSFIVVGLLILLIGYLSPLPPRTKEQTEQ